MLTDQFFSSDIFCDDFFIEIAENKLKIARDKFRVRLVIFTSASNKNVNYSSAVYCGKLKVEIKSETTKHENIDFYIKASFLMVPELKSLSDYPREKFMYDNVVKSLERIWDDANVKVKFSPECYKILSEPYDVIVLEDLREDGFEVLDRKLGLDLDETKLVLTKMAKFHAASAVRYQKEGKINDCLDRTLPLPVIATDNPIVRTFQRMHAEFVDTVLSLDLTETCKKRVASWSTQSLLMNSRLMALRVASQPMRCGFQVLNHGDNWVDNMLFKRNVKGEVCDVKFIDYQMSFWGSPITDLMYFLLTSVRDEIKTAHFDEFVAFYHKELLGSLIELKYKEAVPTLDALKQDLMEKRGFLHGLFLHVLVVVKFDSDKDFDILSFMRGSAEPLTLRRMYKNEAYLKAIQYWLPFFENRGLLDKTF